MLQFNKAEETEQIKETNNQKVKSNLNLKLTEQTSIRLKQRSLGIKTSFVARCRESGTQTPYAKLINEA